MKKRLILLAAVLVVVPFMFACATPYPAGGLYTEVKLPIGAADAPKASKVGTSQCISILGMVAIGDASIRTAMKNGGIKKIRYVDFDAKNILGVYGVYKTTVYGQ